ncbi:MAG: hypothetical protein MUE38_00575 [Flavihumibacter sp.]|nr:hypothetical protein [Flavihumibacter sp.]
MKLTGILLGIFICSTCFSQDDACVERILAKNGGWKKGRSTLRANAANYAIQKRYTDAAHTMLAAYQPRGVQAEWYSVHGPLEPNTPVSAYSYVVMGMRYQCKGDSLSLAHETYNVLNLQINGNFNNMLYDNSTDYQGLGFHELREGIPEEIQPGIWKFKDIPTPLGFGINGLRKCWLLTYPGQLPWSFVTRKEFLQTRRKNLLRLLKEEEENLRKNLEDLERQKKDIEKILKNDPDKWAAYLKNDYEPAPGRYQEQFNKTKSSLDRAIERVNEQLEAPESELNQRAIVAQSSTQAYDYNFVQEGSQFSRIPVKPNPAYYKKGLGPSVPQFMELGIKYNPEDRVSLLFVQEMEKLINLQELKTWIAGKTNSAATKVPVSSMTTSRMDKPASTQQTSVQPGQHKSSTAIGKNGFLSGKLSAPAGVSVTLSNNGGNDLALTTTKDKTSLYTITPIKFSLPVKEKDSYQVAIKKMPSNMKGVVYHGNGKAPEGISSIRVAIDYTYELVSRASDETFSSFYESSDPAVGGMGGEEGRYIVFVSWTKGFAGNDGKYRQIFWRDRNTGITKIVSTASDGTPGNESSAQPTISADGQTVVFESRASNLVAGDENKVRDVFMWNATTGKLERVSIPEKGGWSNGDSYDAMVSGDGQQVVFTSDASNLTEIPKGRSQSNVFIHNLVSGVTEILSVEPATKTGGNAHKGSISFDGRRVVFCSPTPTLVTNDTNNLWDIFLWERGKQGLRRISMTQDGSERNQGDESGSRRVAASISGNGRWVVYATTATNMVPGDLLKYQDVFVYDIETGKLQVASFTEDGKPGNQDSPIEQGERLAITHDGSWVAFPTKATNLGVQGSNILLYNTQTGNKQVVTDTRGSYVGRPAISYAGSYVVFGKSESLDKRSGVAFGSNGGGIFAHFTGLGYCRACEE